MSYYLQYKLQYSTLGLPVADVMADFQRVENVRS